jgi:hypothetical protein
MAADLRSAAIGMSGTSDRLAAYRPSVQTD